MKRTKINKDSSQEKQLQAIDLRFSGNSYREIAAAMGCSVSTAYEYCSLAMNGLIKQTQDKAELYRERQLAVIDKALKSATEKQDWPLILKLQEREAKLLGLDAPTKIQAVLSDLELAKIALDNGVEVEAFKETMRQLRETLPTT